jgi:hypothetical protein
MSATPLRTAASPDLELEDVGHAALKRAGGIVRCLRSALKDAELSAAAWAAQNEIDTALAALERWNARRAAVR